MISYSDNPIGICEGIALYKKTERKEERSCTRTWETDTRIKVKGKVDHAPRESVVERGAHLPLLGLEPVRGEPLMSVTHGQCNAGPTVIFPAARHHHPLAGTKLYCLVTEAHVC